MNDQKEKAPRLYNGNGLTDEERKWLRQRIKTSEHVHWLLSTARKLGIVLGSMVAGFGSAMGMILALKEILKWLAGNGK